jgi:transposase
LLSNQIKEVIIESTGIYWIALCSVLTLSGIHVTVVNPKFIKNMPKEKTDKKDARWLCKLLVNGLVRNSFVASEDQRAFRDLCRMRTRYRNHIGQATNRIVKNLERRNIKLKSVVSNMHTVSAMAIVKAIAAGETDIEKLVALCKTKLKKKKEQMRKALQGVITMHDRMVLKQLLGDISHYENQQAIIDSAIKKHTEQVNDKLIADLQQVPGIGPQSTEIILAEIGSNVTAFSNEDKLAAWVGLAPGNKESAGKAYYAGSRDGNVYLRTAMLQVAWSAVRTKNTYWRALYYHLTRRMHSSKAIVAIARKLIRLIYKIIKGTKTYTEYGADYFIQHLQERLQKSKQTPIA